jgi:hypothetical protein
MDYFIPMLQLQLQLHIHYLPRDTVRLTSPHDTILY